MRNEAVMYQEAMIRYYNYLTGKDVIALSEMSEDSIMFLSCFSLAELCRPFVVACIQQGMSIKQISIKYGLSVHVVRGIGRKNYLYSGRDRVHTSTM